MTDVQESVHHSVQSIANCLAVRVQILPYLQLTITMAALAAVGQIKMMCAARAVGLVALKQITYVQTAYQLKLLLHVVKNIVHFPAAATPRLHFLMKTPLMVSWRAHLN